MLLTQTSPELCIMSNPQSNSHVDTRTLNQEIKVFHHRRDTIATSGWAVIHSNMVVVSVDIFKQTFSRDTATAELCQFQFYYSCYFLTILSKSLSCLQGGHRCVHRLVQHVLCEISHQEAPVKGAPLPLPTGEGICTSHISF